jgi:hypothetical protein
MRFAALLDRHEGGELSQGEAWELLGGTERTFRRWRARFWDEGPDGLRERLPGAKGLHSNRVAAEVEQ